MIQDIINTNLHLYGAKIAVKCNQDAVSYDQLSAQAAVIAHVIRDKISTGGIDDSQQLRIGVYMDKSAMLLSAILALIQQGHTYVPIDPETPKERVRFIIEDCEMSLLLTTDKYARNFASDIPVINISDLTAPDVDAVIPRHEIKPSDIAYIIYTSGTTGKPKGVPISYLSIENMLNGYGAKEATDLSDSSVILLFASINFDASIIELFGTLFFGATMVVTPEESRTDMRKLCDLMVNEKVTYCTLPPSLAAILPSYSFPDLQSMVIAGEAMNLSIPQKVLGNGYRLFNGYGPTENTICSTIREITEGTNPLNIGCALPGTVCYAVDQDINPVAVGETGELLVGGRQLMQGYIHLKELNEKLLLRNPFSKDAQIAPILYHTGDMVRLEEDGSFLFIGRKDSQVKLHGFRIELEEIKNQIEQCDGVMQAYVRVEDAGSDKSIVAYIRTENPSLDVQGMKKRLNDFLPAYMIPKYWIKVDAFELTINGKVDESKLHHTILKNENVDYHQPVTANEKLLHAVISHVLGIDHISIDTPLIDEFGISSLQIMQIIAELEFTGFLMLPSDFNNYKTIREIAKNHSTKIGFWYNKPDKNKPTILLLSGYTSFIFLYPAWIKRIEDRYSIFVIESYHSTINDKPRSVDDYIDEYMEVVSPIVEEYGADIITGFCIGGEMGLHLAIRLQQKYNITPHVVVLDGEVDRDKDPEKQIPPVVPTFTKEINDKRFLQDMKLIETMPADYYTGPVTSILSNQYNERLTFNPEIVITDKQKYWARQFFERAPKYWKKAYPDCQLMYVECDHLDFLRDEHSIKPLTDYFLTLATK